MSELEKAIEAKQGDYARDTAGNLIWDVDEDDAVIFDAARRFASLTSPETIDALEAMTIRWFNANAHKGDQGLSLQEAREFVTDLLRSVEEGKT